MLWAEAVHHPSLGVAYHWKTSNVYNFHALRLDAGYNFLYPSTGVDGSVE
jgi:hypothetical protein